MSRRVLCAGAAALFALVSFAGKAEATTITFDAAISGTLAPNDPSDPFDNCVGYCIYAGTPGNDGVFTTQGYRFAAQINGGSGDHGLGTVVDPTLLPGIPDNGTDWLLAGGIVQMTQTDGGAFSLLSFQAADIDPSDATVGQFVRAFGFKNGVFFEAQHFDLNAATGFHTFVLPSTWTGLSSVNFSGRLLPSDGSPRVTAIDNINVTAVPEPATLLLLGSGLALVARRRFQTRA